MSKAKGNKPEVAAILARLANATQFTGVPVDGVNVRGILGETPLHLLAVSGNVRDAKILLEAGADPNIHGEYGNTPLHEAIGQRHFEFVKLLLEHGASPGLQNDDEISAAEYARMSGDSRIREIFD